MSPYSSVHIRSHPYPLRPLFCRPATTLRVNIASTGENTTFGKNGKPRLLPNALKTFGCVLIEDCFFEIPVDFFKIYVMLKAAAGHVL